ncbi:UBX domain protein Ubx2 [Savitreella phatthalungensis]
MEAEEEVASFCAVTGADPSAAQQYLEFAGGDLEQAILLFYESGGQTGASTSSGLNATTSTHSAPRQTIDTDDGPIEIPDDDEDDEAMARRLASEWGGSGAGTANEVRAPIARTQGVLQDEMPFDPTSLPGILGNRFDALGGVMNGGSSGRSSRGSGIGPSTRRGMAPRGIFNQAAPSVWDRVGSDEFGIAGDRELAESTGGASEDSAKSSRLARLFQPPFDIMADVDLESARSEARADSKWIMVNLHDSSDFSCQMLNRDLWKDRTVKAIVKEHFLFLQYNKDSDDGLSYLQFYPVRRYPHISILDPRTGEKVREWDRVVEPVDFISEVTEFLESFSLDEAASNPVHKRPKTPAKRPEDMSEEEQLNAAILASAGFSAGNHTNAYSSNDNGTKSNDNETRAAAEMDEENNDDVQVIDAPADDAFSRIPAEVGSEPAASAPDTTRIQLRLPKGRIVRRFNLNDPVEQVFSFVKTQKPGARFKIVFNRDNLIDKLEQTVAEAGLKNASLQVEFDEE